jgi:NAD(P) transhydrogenase
MEGLSLGTKLLSMKAVELWTMRIKSVAYYREIARGQISGHTDGCLKILFHRETLELLGVHIFGENAAELLHIGQAVFRLKGKITYFIDTVFNYPTLAECYKTAAFNGLNRLA